MKRVHFWAILGIMTFSIIFGAAPVKAYVYTPSVEVGDEIIWEYQTELTPNDENYYLKHKITTINDYNDSTTAVFANESLCEKDGTPLWLIQNKTVGVLEDYVQKGSIGDIVLQKLSYIVPGFKVGLYTDDFAEDPNWGNFTYKSINRGYGIEIEITGLYMPLTRITCVYTKSGILEKYYEVEVDGTRDRRCDLYSINGEKFRKIPGFTPSFLLLFSFVAVFIVLRKMDTR